MAHHMSSILGSALVTSPLGDTMPADFPSPEVLFCTSDFLGGDVGSLTGFVWFFSFLQELKGKFLIKGKRLNKLEAIFAQEAAAEDTDVTEEEESGDEDEDEDEQKEKVRAVVGG